MDKSNVLVLAGPTGVGESSITKELIRKFPIFKKLIAATSRSPRGNEKNGIDYYFFSKEEFEQKIKEGDVIEYTYIANRDAYYGSYKPDMDEKIAEGFSIIVNVDIVGAKYFKENYGATTIFINPDSIENLKKRIRSRNPEISEEELEKRMENAKKEMKEEEPYYDYTITNHEGKMNEAVEEIVAILKKSNYELC